MEPINEKNTRIAKNTLFLYVRMAIVMFASLYTARIVLNVLGVVDYGIYNVVCGFVFLLNVLNTTLSNGILRFYNNEIGNNNAKGTTSVFNTSIKMQVIIAILAFVILETIGLWYIDSKMVIPLERLSSAKVVFQFSVFSLLLLILQAPYTSSILAYEKMNFYAAVSIIDVSLKLGLAFLLQVISSDKLVLYGVLTFIISLINFSITSGYCLIKFKEIHFTGKYDNALMKQMLSFSGWLILDPIAYTMRGQGSNMVMNLFFGTIVNAAYGISNQIAAALDSFCSGISTAFKPQLMQSYATGCFDRTRYLLFSMSKIIFILKLMLCIPIIIEIDTVLSIWLGDGVPSYAASFTSLTVIVRLIDSLNLPISNVILASGRIRNYMGMTSLVVCCTMPLAYFLFRIGFPPYSLFIVMIILTAMNQIISILVICKTCNFFSPKDYCRNVVVPCIVQSIIVLLTVWGVSSVVDGNIFRLILVCISSLFVSILSAFLIVLDANEKQMLLQLKNKIIKK